MLHVGKRLATSAAGDDPRPSRWALSSDWEVAGPESGPQDDGPESGSVRSQDAQRFCTRPGCSAALCAARMRGQDARPNETLLRAEFEAGDLAEVSRFRGDYSASAGKGTRHL